MKVVQRVGTAFRSVGRTVRTGAESLGAGIEDVDRLGREAVDDFMAAAGEAGRELAQGTQELFSDLRSQADERHHELGESLAGLLEDALPGLDGMLEHGMGVLEAGSGVVGLAAALAPPLEWAQATVGAINDLLEAMNLGL